MQFTIRQIELFVAVCEHESISRAAEAEHIAQSAVSTAIRNLEAALNVSLLVRSHAVGVQPTAAGRDLLIRSRQLIDDARGIENFASALSERIEGPVRVGFLVTVAPLTMPRVIRSFGDRYPAASIVGVEGDQDELMGWLQDGSISAAVTYDLGGIANVTFSPLHPAPPHVLLSASDPLADSHRLTLREIAKEPFVLLDLPWSVDYFLEMFRAVDLEPRVAYRTRNMDVVRSLVGQQLGYSIINLLPGSTESIDGARLAAVPLDAAHGMLHLGVAINRERHQPAVVRALVDHLRTGALTAG
jgi:DNA-binding transcriptional LysR family regulator